VLLLVVFLNTPLNHSHRWISLGSITLQPSEFMKVALALKLAAYFRNQRTRDRRDLRALMRPLGYTMLPAILILIEPDLGTALVICGIGLSVMLFEGVHTKSFLTLVGIVLLLFPLAWKFDLIRSYQKARIQLWLGVEPEGADWKEKHSIIVQKTLQPERARWSIGSGKFSGKGARKGSRIRLKYLPEMHTDFVVATLAEEYGFVGCSLMLLLFYLYISWSIRMAQDATDRFGALASFGLASMVAIQVFVNLGMVTGVIPVVGVTLPLFSYGGSSLVACMLSFGIIMSVARSKGAL
jgi:rod shape determining protein RodA